MFGVPLCSIGLLLVALIHTAVTTNHLVMGGVGHTVILPCVSTLEGSCSDKQWFHGTQSSSTLVARIPTREAANTARVNIWANCSLHINHITQVDVGVYWCEGSNDWHYLSLITVFSWPRSNLLPGANVTLSCGLITYEGPDQCFTTLYRGMSLKLQDDTRPDYMLATRRFTKCHVTLRVPIQRGSRFSCLALVDHQVQSRVQFPVQVEGRRLPMPDLENNKQDGDNSQVIISVAVVCCAMTVALLALIIVKKNRKPNDQLVAHPETPLHVNTVINTDVPATAEDVTYADITLAGMADRKWESESETTVYADIQPTTRNNV